MASVDVAGSATVAGSSVVVTTGERELVVNDTGKPIPVPRVTVMRSVALVHGGNT